MQRPIRSSFSAIKAAVAEIIGIQNITSEVAAEKFADEKFRLAVDACPSGMVMTDSAGTILLANIEMGRLFGYQRDELIGRPIEILVPERLRGEQARDRAKIVRHPETPCLAEGRNLSGLRRDGAEFPIEVRINPIRSGGNILLLSAIADISERVRMDRLKDEFVSTVSHELRTPLTSISGSLGLLIGGAAGQLPESALRLISIAQSNSQRLVRLINDILDIEKIESGQVDFNYKRLDTRLLAEQVIEANRGFADGFGVHARLDAAPASISGEVYADPDRLAQVITNLLSNAIKFSPPDGEVVIAIVQRGDVVRISVRDHGPGIPLAFRPRVFEKFSQADATDARQKGGTGLGLSIVKQIVGRLGGKVGFQDAPGGGTVFYVDLLAWSQVETRAIDADRSPNDARVLFCEDDPDAAVALREALRPFRFSTDFAHSPAESIARAQLTPYAAIVVDLELPEGDGIGLIRRLRAQPENYKTPIVALSADHGRDKAGRPGIDDLNVTEWLEKPVNTDRLAQILDSTMTHEGTGRPHILHVDDDPDVLDLVAGTLGPTASVISADSIEQARRALLLHQFDLAVLDMNLGSVSGLDLLPDLRSRRGAPIPVIIFSAHAAEQEENSQIEATLSKSRASLDRLVAAVHDRLMLKSPQPREEVL